MRDNFIGAKIIKAEKVTYEKYCLEKYGKIVLNPDIHPNTIIYMIVYPPIGKSQEKPYISYCPVDVFEIAYRKIEACEISLMIGD